MKIANYNRIWGFLCAVGIVAISVSNGAVAAIQDTVATGYQLSAAEISLHEPVFIVFSIRNELNDNVDFDLGSNRTQNFVIAINEPNGALVTRRRPEPREGMNRVGTLTLAPGETYRQRILVNEFYQFKTPGTYRISARMIGSITTRSGVSVKPPPGKEMTLAVGPTDPEKLGRVCQQLVDSGMSSNAEGSMDAARALSYVGDLVAAPFLERLTEKGPFLVVVRPIAVHGLARIANREGIDRVMSKLNHPSPDLESSIRAAQSVIQSGFRRSTE
jgi:hypothetical protein